ncbi:S1/P1 nuclease, partial [Delitschia confertaspora ATCC 74209]
TLAALLPLLPQAHAWGALGHETVAYVAQSYLLPATKQFAQNILNDTSNSYLANVATWADSYRYTAEGAFSAVLHYIDANDNPPESCDVDFERDCTEEGCIVSAIANHTSRVVNKKLPAVEIQKSLKWIIHFLGDIHQPLHDEALEVGGNTISVLFNGTTTNLHHIWDSNIPEQYRKGYQLSDAQLWSKALVKEINTGKWKWEKLQWLLGINPKDSIGSAMVWARDTNKHVCDTVLPDGAEVLRGKDLSGDYASKAVPVIEMQIAKAGFRLAAWLNGIV